MPFGLVFGAVVFTVLSLWFGVRSMRVGVSAILRNGFDGPALPVLISGIVLVVLGLSLSVGLVRRSRLARWTGVVTAVFLAVLALANLAQGGMVLDHVVLLAAFSAAFLLVLPATGDVRRGLEDGPQPDVRRGGVMGWTALASFAALVLVYAWAWVAQGPAIASTLPAYGSSVEWMDFGPGLEKAKAEGKPILVDFYAEWCGPCKAMDRRTFRDPAVVDRLGEIVAVRVDSEETESSEGYVGSELAARYRVLSYPTLMILNGEGDIVASRRGYQDARQLLSWIEDTLADGLEGESPEDMGLAL